MLPKMIRRGRPKGGDLTVVGLPNKRTHNAKHRRRPKLFINKSATEKEACKSFLLYLHCAVVVNHH